MAAGFDLKEGTYIRADLPDKDYWNALYTLFTSASINDSTYKYGFLVSIIKCLKKYERSLRLSFDQLFYEFADTYWSLIAIYGLMQKRVTKDGRASSIDRIILHAKFDNNLYEQEQFTELGKDLQASICEDIKVAGKRYVVGAVFEDTKHLFYDFSKKKEFILLNPRMVDVLEKNESVILKLDKYEWAKLLEKINTGSSAFGIIGKLENSIRF
jgi:hypothetical protein